MTAITTKTAQSAEDFPEVEITVEPLEDRARAVFAKTHQRRIAMKFDEALNNSRDGN